MAFSYTSDALVASIKRRGRVPTSQTTFTPPAIRAMCDEEIALGLLPTLLKSQQNYLMWHETYEMESNVSSYRVPPRAIGQKINSLIMIDQSGNEWPVSEIAYQDRGYYVQGSTNCPVYYLDNNKIVIVPTPVSVSQPYQLRVTYYIRPNSLIPVAEAALIAAIDRDANSVTVETLPPAIQQTELTDLIKGTGGFECAEINQSISAIVGTVITFTETLPSDLEEGDYVCLAGESPIPQIPAELHPILSLRVTCVILEALGFEKEMATAQKKLIEAEKATKALLSPRTDASPKKINARNSTLRSRSR